MSSKIFHLWHRLFLAERPSISLSFFRLSVAWTTGAHVIPTFFFLQDNYFSTAFKQYNTSFFPVSVIELIQKSPEGLIIFFVVLFCLSWFLFLIGLFSQISCIIMTFCGYYFYALNSFHIGTLSWDILLVTLFLMCCVSYHGDYFSVDCLFRGSREEGSLLPFQRRQPYFLQRLLQLQIGFTFFYTALYKVSAEGNWIKGNPIYYIMNYPPPGTTKLFLLRDFLMDKPQVCYVIGIFIVTMELLILFLLFCRRTRLSAIYLGWMFHCVLILTLDVPAIFLFLFPIQLLLFINPEGIERWIAQKRLFNENCAKRPVLLYDGRCQFCRRSVNQLSIMDLFNTLKMEDLHHYSDPKSLHPDLTYQKAMSQLHLIEPDGTLYGGFRIFQRICFPLPMLWPLIFLFYFPGMGGIGPLLYRFVAKNRYLLHWNPSCKNNACYR